MANDNEEIWNGAELVFAISRGESYESIVARINPGVKDKSWRRWGWIVYGAQNVYRAMDLRERHEVCGQLIEYFTSIESAIKATKAKG